MSKIFMTKKEVRNAYPNKVFAVPYCALANLLKYEEPVGYHSGVYGWNCDFYVLESRNGNHIVVSTGYNPTGIKVDSKVLAYFEHNATEVLNMPYGSARMEAYEQLLKDFVACLLHPNAFTITKDKFEEYKLDLIL